MDRPRVREREVGAEEDVVPEEEPVLPEGEHLEEGVEEVAGGDDIVEEVEDQVGEEDEELEDSFSSLPPSLESRVETDTVGGELQVTPLSTWVVGRGSPRDPRLCRTGVDDDKVRLVSRQRR